MQSVVQKILAFVSSYKFKLVLIFLGIYLLVSGGSLLAFSLIKRAGVTTSPGTKTTTGESSRVNLSLPKTESCPVNGLMYTKDEKKIWEERRPITAMIENHADSRPPSGLSRTDMVYEAVAEGGITRFLTVFYCSASAQDVRIGPIRSVRVYFVNWAAEYQVPLFVHSGGANNICSSCPGGVKPRGDVDPTVDAFKLLAELKWRSSTGNTMDAGTNVGYPIVWRDYERIPGAATEHTFMGSTDKLFEEGSKRGFGYENAKGEAWTKSFVMYKFADDKPLSSPVATQISFEFWKNKPDYDVSWKYDSANNVYLRFNGGKEHIDMDTKEQLSAKDVVVMFVKEKGPIDKEGHMFYTNIGSGEALVFQNGDVIKATWSKKDRFAKTIFSDVKSGKEISMVRGRIWIEALPVGNEVAY